jgi:ankyrin repeat protein
VKELDLDQARRRAKELLRAARAGDPDARARMRDDRAPRLADAQRAIAADLGFSSWPAMVAHVETGGGDREQRRARLVSAALNGRDYIAERLLADDPALAEARFDVAVVLGEERIVAAALDRDPGLVARDLPGPGRKPLSCACHSVFLRPSSPRAPGVRRVVALLLDRGADVNEVHRNEYGAMSVLYGAAGVAHDPETARLLFERGANPNDGESVYHAVEADDTACLEILLDAGATVRGTNALANAIRDARKVRVLQERGDLRPSDPELRHALLHAIHDEVAELLIAHGAALDARDADGLTPYARAARRGDVSLMALLERAGAPTDVDPVADWLGAVVRGDEEHAARCLAADPQLPSRLRASDAELLPMWASAGKDAGVARVLDAGVPIDARGVDDGTTLHYAGMWGRASTVELLLARGAGVDAMGGPRELSGTALAWTAWESRALPGAAERLAGYLGAAIAQLEAGARVTEGMADVAADEVAVLLEEAADRAGIVRETGRSYVPGRLVRVSVRRRGVRYDINDMGGAVAISGRPPGWRETAEACGPVARLEHQP